MHPETVEALHDSLQSLIIGLADQQAVLGLAILIIARQEFDVISAYHFNFITLLAWWASIMHAISILSLTWWLAHSTFLIFLRATLFISLFGMFLWAQIESRDYRNGDGSRAACPASCAARGPYSSVSLFLANTLLRVGSLLVTVIATVWISRRGASRDQSSSSVLILVFQPS